MANEHVWFGMKVQPDEKRRIKMLAARRGVSAKELIMRLVNEAFASGFQVAGRGGFLDGLEDVVGSVYGPADLSSSKEYLSGYGE